MTCNCSHIWTLACQKIKTKTKYNLQSFVCANDCMPEIKIKIWHDLQSFKHTNIGALENKIKKSLVIVRTYKCWYSKRNRKYDLQLFVCANDCMPEIKVKICHDLQSFTYMNIGMPKNKIKKWLVIICTYKCWYSRINKKSLAIIFACKINIFSSLYMCEPTLNHQTLNLGAMCRGFDAGKYI